VLVDSLELAQSGSAPAPVHPVNPGGPVFSELAVPIRAVKSAHLTVKYRSIRVSGPNGREIFSMPWADVLRLTVMNHLIHHRAQLSVYLRLLDVPVPGMYGPSADEMPPSA
jgi:DinB family